METSEAQPCMRTRRAHDPGRAHRRGRFLEGATGSGRVTSFSLPASPATSSTWLCSRATAVEASSAP